MKLYVRLKRKPILQLLARRHMSQNTFAKEAHLTSGHLSQLLAGKRNVSPTTRENISKVLGLGVPFEEVFEERFKK